MGYWASTQSTQTQEFRQESGTRNQIQVSGQPDPSSWFLSHASYSIVCLCLITFKFGSHVKLDPGRRCPRQPHIVNKEGRSYAVTNPWWRRMPPRRNGGRNARGGASDANGAEVVFLESIFID